jgi:hypothetical protein
VDEQFISDYLEKKDPVALRAYADWLMENGRDEEAMAVVKGLGVTKVKRFDDLIGKVMSSVENKKNEELIFTVGSGERYRFYYEPD